MNKKLRNLKCEVICYNKSQIFQTIAKNLIF